MSFNETLFFLLSSAKGERLGEGITSRRGPSHNLSR
jgi:hypothetical protein